jgi:hypothetical protein
MEALTQEERAELRDALSTGGPTPVRLTPFGMAVRVDGRWVEVTRQWFDMEGREHEVFARGPSAGGALWPPSD